MTLYLGVPAHIADAYDPRRDAGAFHFGGGWVKRHGKCLAPVQDLNYPAIERPYLRAAISETNQENKSPKGRHERVSFRQQTRNRCTALPSFLQG